MDLGFQNFSQASSLHALNRFQDMYISPHHYEPPKITTTTEKPGYLPATSLPDEGFRDRFWAPSWSTGGGASDNINRQADGFGGGGNSAAISALGLLAFLFFLNLIQNSLINNRWNLLGFAVNRTVAAGRSDMGSLSSFDSSWKLPLVADTGPIGKKRQRRSPPLIGQTPAPITLDPTDQNTREFSGQSSGHHPYQNLKLMDHPRHSPSLRRVKRQTNATPRRVRAPLKCVVQFYTCAIARRLNPNKLRRNNAQPIGLMRKFFVLPIKDRAGNNRVLEQLVPRLQQGQPPKSCRVLFNQCRDVTSSLTFTG